MSFFSDKSDDDFWVIADDEDASELIPSVRRMSILFVTLSVITVIIAIILVAFTVGPLLT